MTMDLLRRILEICLFIGFIIPMIDILLGSLDLSLDTSLDGVIPFNIMCFSFALIVFSASGLYFIKVSTNTLVVFILLCMCFIASILAYIILYKFIVRKLKANNPLALKPGDLIGMTGTVVLRITPGSEGVISVKDSTGANITYRAALSVYAGIEGGYVISQGQEVIIADFNREKKICYVILPKGNYK